MATIKFTIGDTDIWHEFHRPYNLSKKVTKDVQDLCYIIKQIQNDFCNGKAKKVCVIDDQGVIAKSSDILEKFQLDYYDSNKNDNENETI